MWYFHVIPMTVHDNNVNPTWMCSFMFPIGHCDCMVSKVLVYGPEGAEINCLFITSPPVMNQVKLFSIFFNFLHVFQCIYSLHTNCLSQPGQTIVPYLCMDSVLGVI